MPLVFSIVGSSKSGKTTLLEKIISEIMKRGYRVGTIKHKAHGFEIDQEGKDSWRHKRAGALAVVLSSPNKVALVKDLESELSIDQIVDRYLGDMDIVITEGYKKEKKPKIEVYKKADSGRGIICEGDENLIAIITNMKLDTPVPCFGPKMISELVDFLDTNHFKKHFF